MTAGSGHRFERGDASERTSRDLARLRRRTDGTTFWRSLALIGSIGWPIALLALGGALVGRAIDVRLGTGIHATLVLLVAGTALGTWIAYLAVRRGPS